MSIVVRLLQSLPLVIALIIIAAVVYFVVAWWKSPERAKEILIQFFTVLSIVLSAFFALASLYALIESNMPVLELTGAFLVVMLVALAITRICNWRFKKNHPEYQEQKKHNNNKNGGGGNSDDTDVEVEFL